MKIIFVRHAQAIENTQDHEDAARFLTPEGRLQIRRSAKTMRDKGLDPNLILTSPFLRAVQTADILAEKISYSGSLIPVKDLSPGFDREGMQRLLAYYKTVEELVLVGHEPDLGMLVSRLLSLPEDIKLRKGSAVKLSVDPANPFSTAAFKWLVDGRIHCVSEKKLVP